MNLGKNINVFLMDGNINGRIKCTLANWTGVAYKVARKDLEMCENREHFNQSGVYFLFGITDNDDENIVYIGQAGARKNGDGILNRLLEHKAKHDNDYWNEVILFTTTNNSFGPTEISYLENNFFKLASEAGRYMVKNGNEPTHGNVTEEKESELKEFIEYSKIIMGTLGHKVFESYTQLSTKDDNININDKIFYLKRNSQKSKQIIKAKCRQTNEGFVVLKGSMIEMIESAYIPEKIRHERENAKIDDNNILQENKLFRSPSYAAAFVVGGNTNGLTDWKDESGKSLKKIEAESCLTNKKR